MIDYVFNGEQVLSEPLSIAELVATRIGNDQGVAVAVDGAVVPRSQWDQMIKQAQVVDVLTAIQGG